MTEKEKRLIAAGEDLGIKINDEQSRLLIAYMEKILEANKEINLTRIIDEEAFMVLHLLDSLSVLKFMSQEDMTVLDVGTGGGFPGIPLGIMMNNSKITLLDSTKKKLMVVEKIAEELGINNVEFIHARAEECGQDPLYREKFDVVVSRAVANLTHLGEYCLPLTKIGGVFLAMKGRDYLSELEVGKDPIRILGGKIRRIEKSLLLQDEGVHVIIEIEKIKRTPRIFPRLNGKIRKDKFPLI
ncbi:MAG: 16S rRNA (guanine(527)-N(7))-methyltransferase RsmG [Eubacteriaceae bacterium]